jgi:Helix-turn-helix domain
MTKSATTFTGRKLDFLNCVAFDRQVQSIDFRVMFVIAQHVNEKTGTAFLSDETIADKTGGGSPRNVYRARLRLQKAGWLNWRRSRTANVYTLRYDKMNAVLDMIAISNDARRKMRLRRPPRYDSGVRSRPARYDRGVRT